METRVYYGEYSLDYWITLLISGDLVLPEYQRSFVWREKDIKRLIKSFQNKQFIQPVTIGCDFDKRNIILDGQQRLTSILLAYIKLVPDINKMAEVERFVSEDDGGLDEDLVQPKVVKWTFSELLDIEKKEVKADLKQTGYYKELDFGLSRNFFRKTFLGFSYIIPDSEKREDYSVYYSHLFRNMNYLGRKLSVIESRRSLYYLNKNFNNLLDGKMNDGKDILCNLRIKEKGVLYNIDFVRYLSILSQKFIDKAIMVGYSAFGSRENYYADYVSYLQGLEQEERENKFDYFDYEKVFEPNVLIPQLDALNGFVSSFLLPVIDNRIFPSIIDADYWLFGLIYWYVFEKKMINIDKVGQLKAEIIQSITDSKKDDAYIRSPNRLGHVRNRVMGSCSKLRILISSLLLFHLF